MTSFKFKHYFFQFQQLKHASAHLFNLRGHDVSYRLVDIMFDRKLFTHYSWTGLSKSGQKLPFNVFIYTHMIFKKLVHQHDTTYSDADVKHYFQKKNMHHSDRRSEKPILRASASKVRGG